ncbi:uncharacterized protein LOC112889462 [Panicum hallii]|jgi:translation initiation factor IF-2|uniref:uncharacterized protein LOC112889462 n=1 Tax=Panicum hallii TaxID=206008 RepID=UPI000DF4E4DE|nr:uncharacterized protein LOC112889462 [Panicum hallii]
MGTGDSMAGPCGDSRRPWPALRRRLGGDPRLSLPAAAQPRCSSPPAAKEARAGARAPAILGGARSSRLAQPSPPRQCSSSSAPAVHQACRATRRQLRSPAPPASLPACSPPAALACFPGGAARLLPTSAVRAARPGAGSFRPGGRPGQAARRPNPIRPWLRLARGRPAPARSWPRSVPSCGGLAPPPPDPGCGRRGTARHPGVAQRDGQKIARAWKEGMLQSP